MIAVIRRMGAFNGRALRVRPLHEQRALSAPIVGVKVDLSTVRHRFRLFLICFVDEEQSAKMVGSRKFTIFARKSLSSIRNSGNKSLADALAGGIWKAF